VATAAALAAAAAAAWGSSPRRSPAGLQAVRARGYLVVAVERDAPPLARQAADGRVEGLEPDLGRELARALLGEADRVRFVAGDPAERRRMLADGAADLAFGLWPGAPGGGLGFSRPYHGGPVQLLAKRGSPVRKLRDLDGRVVAAVAGEPALAAVEAAARRTGARPVGEALGSYAQVAEAVAEGRASAAAAGPLGAAVLRWLDPNLRTVAELRGSPVAYRLAAPGGSGDLLAEVDRALAALAGPDGSGPGYRRILRRWGLPPPAGR
jgi:polar amino acid transport system substrate-binding protein